jgi:capsular exopolysaccharide synthesis family protein
MSRIHEALKKAEQERAAAQGGAAQRDFASTEMPDATLSSELSEAGSAAMAGPSVVSAISSSFSLEALLARSAKAEWKPDSESMLFMNGNDSARGTEEYRTLRSRLYHMREKMPLKKLLVTSALPKEGKSFTSANLAQVMVRQHGRRALLIGGDLRGPQLHLMLGAAPGPGLSDYLQGKSDEFSIMQQGTLENLFFIPGGSAIENPAECIGNGRLKLLLQRVEALFDWIIVDSPPAVAVSDASVLAKACDGVIMVVRSNETPYDLARKARQEFPDQALVGIVLNGTLDPAASYEKYYYERYEKKGNKTQGE